MKPSTRDNLIYVAVGLSIAAFLTEQVLFSDTHGRVLANLSSLVFRAGGATIVVGYFVARVVRNSGATLSKVALYVVVVSALQLGISLYFRQYVGQLSGLAFIGLATIETFLIVSLAAWIVSHAGRHQKTG
jgi:hypothetical protein